MITDSAGSVGALLRAECVLSRTIGTGNIIVNDYVISMTEIEGGHRLTVTKGSETQSMANKAPSGS